MFADFGDGADVRMVERRGRAGFLEQAGGGLVVLLGEDLDGNCSLESWAR